MKKIRVCAVCSIYTFEEEHCKHFTISAHPPLYNPRDPYGNYRRIKKGM